MSFWNSGHWRKTAVVCSGLLAILAEAGETGAGDWAEVRAEGC
jgi:hypothetical protein